LWSGFFMVWGFFFFGGGGDRRGPLIATTCRGQSEFRVDINSAQFVLCKG